MTAAPAGCPECRLAAPPTSPDGLVRRFGAFLVHPMFEAAPVPGWFVVSPTRHVEQWDALSEDELREVGPLVAQVTAALRAETPTAKVYVSVFAEVLPHLHVHVIARPPDLPAEKRGARLFLAEGALPEPERDALARRVLARLSAAGRTPPSPWTPALLSGLLWPGAGQLKNRRYLKAAAFGLASLGILLRIAWRVAQDSVEALLAAPAPPDFFAMWALAEEVRARNAPEFSVLTLLLVALWAASVFDAWRDSAPRP